LLYLAVLATVFNICSFYSSTKVLYRWFFVLLSV